MNRLLLSTSVGILALFAGRRGARADDALLTLQKDPKQWVTPTGDYANLRYSALKADHPRKRRQAGPGVELLHRRAARP